METAVSNSRVRQRVLLGGLVVLGIVAALAVGATMVEFGDAALFDGVIEAGDDAYECGELEGPSGGDSTGGSC